MDIDGVAERIDLDSVAARLDVEKIVARMDLAKLSLEVIERIDLPEIIRSSTGTVASEGVRVIRMQSFGADRALTGLVNRVFGRRPPALPDEDTLRANVEAIEREGLHVSALPTIPMVNGSTITTTYEALARTEKLGDRLVRAMVLRDRL